MAAGAAIGGAAMKRATIWLLAFLGIAIGSVAMFLLAAALFPGNPGRVYMIVCLVALGLTLAVRLFGARAA